MSYRCVLLATLVLASCTAPPETSRATAPPVVLISIDTLRADRLPAYGYEGVETPAIDALRRDAVLARRAFSPYPLTLPAHASILTGVLPTEHGIRDNVGYRLDPATPYLPRQLQQQGYRTGAAVSSFVLRGDSGLAAGFELYDDRLDSIGGTFAGAAQRPGGDTLARALSWLEDIGSAPFFLFVHFYEPHTPYAPPAPFAARYADPYDGEIAAVDAVVGELIAALKERGDYERALIVLLADHGEGLGDHGEAEHGILLHREALHVPLLLKLPGGERAGDTVEAPVSLVDVAPTIRRLVGLPEAGESILRLDQEAGRPIYAETFYPRLQLGWSELTSLIEGDWHYIGGPRPELYDLAADFGETNNLYSLERRRARAMAAELDTFAAPLEAPAAVDAETAARLATLGYLASSQPQMGGEIDPKQALPIFEAVQAAVGRLRSGDAAGAALAFEAILAEQPENPAAWEHLGLARAQLGDDEAAADAFDRALGMGGGRGSLLVAARVLFRLGRPAEARSRAELALDADPVGARTTLAELTLTDGDVAGAAAHVEAALASRPQALAPRFLAARVALAQGDLPATLAAIEVVENELAARVEADPPAGLHRIAAEALAGLGRRDAARVRFEAAIEQDPSDLRAQTRLAALLVHLGRPAEAIGVLNSLLVANPTPEAYEATIATLTELGNPTQAAALRRKAKALFGQPPETR